MKNQIQKLRKIISEYNYFYHTLYQPLVSDAEYDYLLNQLNLLESNYKNSVYDNSPSQEIGSCLFDSCSKIKHLSPMLSLDNTCNLKGYLNFEKKIHRLIDSKKKIFCAVNLKLMV